jgi:hypothetical protein
MELMKIHGSELEHTRLVPFNVDTAYAVGGGISHVRYVNVSIVLCLVLSVYNTNFYRRLALGDEVVDHGSYARQ